MKRYLMFLPWRINIIKMSGHLQMHSIYFKIFQRLFLLQKWKKALKFTYLQRSQIASAVLTNTNYKDVFLLISKDSTKLQWSKESGTGIKTQHNIESRNITQFGPLISEKQVKNTLYLLTMKTIYPHAKRRGRRRKKRRGRRIQTLTSHHTRNTYMDQRLNIRPETKKTPRRKYGGWESLDLNLNKVFGFDKKGIRNKTKNK